MASVYNNLFAMLMQGVPPDSYYGRVVLSEFDPNSHRHQAVLDILVPRADAVTMGVRAERLVQIARGSVFADRLAAADPINTYRRALVLPAVGQAFSSEDPNIRVSFQDDAEAVRTLYPIRQVFTMLVDGAGDTFTVNGGAAQELGYASGKSGQITLYPGREIVLQGALPASTFQVVVEYTNPGYVDWSRLVFDLRRSGRVIMSTGDEEELRTAWESDPSFVNKLGAVLVWLLENSP